MPIHRTWIIALIVPFLLAFRQCQARANVTMHLGLTYDSSRNCDESPYKVFVCVGHKVDKCRIFGPHLFYVQAACAAYGPKEVIQFEVDNVREPLRVDATIVATSNGEEFQLQQVTANLTFPRPIDSKTKNLKIILQFQFAYACVTDYFGELCDVYCSSGAKEYRCTLNGAKICNPGYSKDNETGTCIYDRCGSMSSYCQNGGRCANRPQSEEDASDTATMPVCICPPTHMGVRCEILRSSTAITATSTSVTSTTAVPNIKITPHSPGVAVSETLRRAPKNNVTLSRLSKGKGDPVAALGAMEQSSPERKLWYQVMIFTVIAVCLTILAFAVCLVAGCYVVRLKTKANLLRRHQAGHFGDMAFVDGGCLNSPGTAGTGSIAGEVGANGMIPVYLQQCPSLDYSHQTLQRPSSVRSYALSRPPITAGIPPDAAQISAEPPFVFSNAFGRNTDALSWSTIYRSPAKTWGEFGFDSFAHASSPTNPNSDVDLIAHGDTLPTVNSPEAYACRHDAYGYLSGHRNHLADNLTAAPVMNNMLTLRTSTIMSPTQCQRASKSPIQVEGAMVDMRKNDFQMAPATPPSEFADLVIK